MIPGKNGGGILSTGNGDFADTKLQVYPQKRAWGLDSLRSATLMILQVGCISKNCRETVGAWVIPILVIITNSQCRNSQQLELGTPHEQTLTVGGLPGVSG